MKLNKQQKAILAGMVLGDGYIQATGVRNARLRLEHGADQKEYLIWKMGIFPKLFQGKPVYLERVHPISGKTYKYWRIQSNSNPELGKWRKMFYPDGKKQIPESLPLILNHPQGLAVWYMDDGYYDPVDKGSFLYLGRVTKSEAEIARDTIARGFAIASKIYDKKHKGFALYFPVAETKKLHKVIGKYILPIFSYKIAGERPSS